MMSLFSNIKKCREERGLSQEQLAQLVGYKNRSSIARIERGDVNVPQHMIVKFAKAFSVLPGDLMGWDSQENEEFSHEEKSVIYKYRLLNSKGRKTIRTMLDDYSTIPKYRKEVITHLEESY